MMNIKTFKIKLDTFTDKERVEYIGILYNNNVFSKLSQTELLKFQNEWNPEKKSFDEFKIAQNKIIRFCLDMEMSEIGSTIRILEGKELLTENTEIK